MSMSALKMPVSAMKTPIAQILTAPIPVLVDKGIMVMDELVKVSILAAKESPGTNFLCPGTNMKYSKTPLYEHPLNTDISLLRTFCFIPGEKSPNIFSKFNPA